MSKTTDIQKSEEESTELSSREMSPPELLSQAVQSGADVEVMERLMGLQERWEENQARKAFDKAMAEIRADLPRVCKNAEVDFTSSKGRTNYKYERLQDVVEAVQPALSEHGLSFRWRTDSSGKDITVTCIISHELGHSEETTLTAPLDRTGNKNAIQSIGSSVTYLQRYTLKAALGIAAAEDDDGQSAGNRGNTPTPKQKPPQNQKPQEPQEPEPASRAQKRLLHKRGVEYYGDGWDDKRHALVEGVTKGRTKSSEDLYKSQAAQLINGIEGKMEKPERSMDAVDDDEIPGNEEE